MTVVSDYTAILQSSISSMPGKAAFYTYSFAAAPPTYLRSSYTADQLATFLPLNDQQKAAARSALDAWASISGITLFEVTKSVGDINFGVYNLAAMGNPGAAGFANYGYPSSRYGISSDVFLANDWASNAYVLLHEIGHALGFKHPFQGTVTLDPALDDVANTVMSYTFKGSTGSVLGPLDIAAAQYLYGNNSNDGTQIASWSWNATTETLTQSGGAGDDTIAGVTSRDVIFGGAGNDTIDAGSGGDSIDGGDGNDTIRAVAADGYGAVSIVAGAGDDSIQLAIDAAAPAFNVDGGSGSDSINIYSLNAKLPLNLTLAGDGTSSGLVTNVERISVSGTSSGDNIIGSAGADSISTFGGNTIIRSGGGNDSLYARVVSADDTLFIDGGDGNDSVSLELGNSTLNVSTLSVLANLVLNGGTGTDTLFFSYYGGQSLTFSIAASFENGSSITGFESFALTGSSGNDRLTGSAYADTIRGNDGNDTIIGGLGQDYLLGGNGADSFVFASAAESLQTARDTIGDFITGVDSIDLLAFPIWNLAIANGQVTGVGLAGNFGLFVSGTITLADIQRQSVGIYAAGTNAADTLTGSGGRDYLNGAAGNDGLSGLGGNDFLVGGAGADRLDGGIGSDVAIYSVSRSQATVTRDAVAHTLIVNAGAEGTDTLIRTEQVQFSDGLYSFNFANAGAPVVANFGVGAGGWSSQTLYPRHVADVNGDGFGDIVGFGQAAGVLVSYGSASGTFSNAALVVGNFGQSTGWTSDDLFRRELGDVNGDGRADIIGFGQAGTLVSLARADGTFGAPTFAIGDFGTAQGWTTQDRFARTVGDVNGDGRADIIGFGQAGTLVALGNGDGTFQTARVAANNFGVAQGWSSDTDFHRTTGDVNGDGRADLIGFGTAGTYVALSNGDGTFQNATLALANFGTNQGWTSNDRYARVAADINHDGFADIIGFGQAGTLIAYGNGDGTFSSASFDLANFGAAQGWSSDAIYHREIADINRDGLADIVGFGFAGVLVAANQGDFLDRGGGFADIVTLDQADTVPADGTGGTLFTAPTSDLARFFLTPDQSNDATSQPGVAAFNHDSPIDLGSFHYTGPIAAIHHVEFLV